MDNETQDKSQPFQESRLEFNVVLTDSPFSKFERNLRLRLSRDGKDVGACSTRYRFNGKDLGKEFALEQMKKSMSLIIEGLIKDLWNSQTTNV